MAAEAQLILEPATLRWLAERHPDWTQRELGSLSGSFGGLDEKWLKRLREADPNDVMGLHSRSRARKTPPLSFADQPLVVQRMLEIREALPENFQLIPGPEAILEYLHRDPLLQTAGVQLPRSQTPMWKILRTHGCIALDRQRKSRPQDRKEPGEDVQMDWQQMRRAFPLTSRTSHSTWSKSPMLWTQEPRSGSRESPTAMFMPKRSWRR
jgi:hypothetical protein